MATVDGRHTLRVSEQHIGQGQLVQQQAICAAGVGGHQGRQRGGRAWRCQPLRIGASGASGVRGWVRICAACARPPHQGRQVGQVGARMQSLVHAAQGRHHQQGQQQPGQPGRLPCARAGPRAQTSARGWGKTRNRLKHGDTWRRAWVGRYERIQSTKRKNYERQGLGVSEPESGPSPLTSPARHRPSGRTIRTGRWAGHGISPPPPPAPASSAQASWL